MGDLDTPNLDALWQLQTIFELRVIENTNRTLEKPKLSFFSGEREKIGRCNTFYPFNISIIFQTCIFLLLKYFKIEQSKIIG